MIWPELSYTVIIPILSKTGISKNANLRMSVDMPAQDVFTRIKCNNSVLAP